MVSLHAPYSPSMLGMVCGVIFVPFTVIGTLFLVVKAVLAP